MSALSLRALTVRYGRQAVLEGLDLDIDEGEFVVLLGPSGCGKSTLLHAMAGLVDVAGGQVLIGGRDMTAADPAERGIGMVFQSYALYPMMSVERNLSFGLRVAGLPKAEVARRVQRTARLLQLEALLQRKPAALSGGQRQRVAIGRALVREASVCLFDEPLSNLDAELRAELRREIKLLHQRLGSTMVYVTHDQVEAMTLATRLVVMQGGRIQQQGAPAEVYAQPANRFVARFVGSPGMNFEDGVLRVEGERAAFVSPERRLELSHYPFRAPPRDGQAVTLGLRPEHLRLTPDGPWQARVQLVEALGAQQVVWLQAGGQALAALQHDGAVPAVGELVRYAMLPDALSLFDAAEGEGRRL